MRERRNRPASARVHARYLPQAEDPLGPSLAPAGSTEALPLVRAGNAWYDPSLPRTAIQRLRVKFWYSGSIDADHPALVEDGLITGPRVWEALHHSKGNEIATVLASGPRPGTTTGKP